MAMLGGIVGGIAGMFGGNKADKGGQAGGAGDGDAAGALQDQVQGDNEANQVSRASNEEKKKFDLMQNIIANMK